MKELITQIIAINPFNKVRVSDVNLYLLNVFKSINYSHSTI